MTGLDLWSSITAVIWDLVRNAGSQALFQTHCISLDFNNMPLPGDLYAQ